MIPWTGLDTRDLGNGNAELTRQLVHVFFYKGKYCRSITPVGYVSDFWTIPRLVRPILDVYGIGNKYAVEHDWLIAADLIPRKVADFLLRQNCILDGRFKPWKYNMIYVGVRCGAHLLERDTTREVCRVRKFAGLFDGDYTTVDPKSIPRPLWPDGICRQ